MTTVQVENIVATASSLPSEGTSSQVFLDHSGRPLRVFVETSEFAFRPKLVRSLRKGGASIAHYPTEAQIILVDLETDAGKQFVNDWGSESGKVVLDWQWARQCIDRGRALLVDDDWGGFCVNNDQHDDTLKAQVDLNKSPLPTPRHTPPGTGLSGQIASQTIPISQEIGAVQLNSLGVPQPTSSQFSAAPSNGGPLPIQSLASALNQQSAQGPSNVLNLLIDALRGSNTSQSQTFPPQTIQQLQMSLLQAGGISQPLPFVQPTALHNGTPQNSQYASLAASDFMHGYPEPAPPATATPQSPTAPLTPVSESVSHVRKKRKASPISAPSSSFPLTRKGKERASSSERPRKLSRSSTTPRSSGSQLASPPSSARRLSVSHASEVELFKTPAGESMSFYVQIETRNRGDLVHAIRRMGGKIVSDVPQADVVVLAPHSKPFADWYKRAEQAQKDAVQASYVLDCISKGSLLDVDSYLFEEAPPIQRGRPPKSPRKVVEVKNPKPKPKPTPKTTNKKTQAPKVQSEAVIPMSHSERSPTPPHKVTVWQEGKTLYSAEEREYINRYLPILIARDPEMPLTSIASKMYEKMSHHSLKSWRSFISRYSSEVDTLKKKAFIARRKAENVAKREEASGVIASPPTVDKSSPEPEASGSMQQSVQDIDPDGFKTMTEFFADGFADNMSDDQVWEALAEWHPSRTAREWQDFWVKNGPEIKDEVDRLNSLADENDGYDQALDADGKTDADIDVKAEAY